MTRTDDVERALHRLGVASGRDLARLLGVSSATVSRAVRAAGPRVCRMGRRRGAMYALRRSIPDLPIQVPVMRVARDGTVEHYGDLSPLEHGAHWFERAGGRGFFSEGTPPFVADMQPQGFLGAGFARWHSDLGLPTRLQDWNDDHRLIALARRGEDLIGNLVVGEESLERLWAQRRTGVKPMADEAYPELARTAAERPIGSSAGGEAPKFLAFSATRRAHVLVKFSSGAGDDADQRWSDLLAAEAIALETLADYGVSVPTPRVVDIDDRRCLEVDRYDRAGEHGRIGVLSMAALDAEYVGLGTGWTAVALALAEQRLIGAADVERIRWLDVFGELIGNTDRHLGNLSFFAASPADPAAGLELAPVYDMLPMALAPAEGRAPARTITPRPPRAAELPVWAGAASAAMDYWDRAARSEHITIAFRQLAQRAGEALRQRSWRA
jgi:hypothetical protein